MLFALAALCWWWTADRMTGMDAGPGTPPGALGWFVGVWVVMMAAMMLPSVAPTVALHARMTHTARGLGAGRVHGRLPAHLVCRRGARVRRLRARPRAAGSELAWDGAGHWVAGGTLLLAGAYELTPLKDACLSKCRSPLGFLLGRWRDGVGGALGMGARHGAWCLGCCWALMASLFALGVMSIAAMAFVAAIIALEKTVPWHRAATWTTAGGADRARRAADRRAGGDPGADGAGRRRDGDAR